MTRVLTYGTFDVLHAGHIHLLQRARALGDHLTVGLSTDAFNQQKHKEALLPFEQRHTVLSAIRHVDAVIAEHHWEQKIRDIRDHAIDIFVMGDDWQGEFDCLRPHCDVVYLPRTPAISSTSLRTHLTQGADDVPPTAHPPAPGA
ncbi:adenylyltransferase/cytidyltransferase family protein [Vreelandella jeotgali]|uniref:adenylyltransferase/cytidyltransferase family protein n=1 Tax=Vreelandella jeotgali TaxID=553386 RepID=UPI000349791E|nr:adenylyltransferase/cytidyltransferase family protein [Halomonas jeotgali]